MELSEQADNMNNRDDLVLFIQTLANDYRNHGRFWENGDLYTYLESLSAWVNDSDGYYSNNNVQKSDPPNWNFIGQMLLAATRYE